MLWTNVSRVLILKLKTHCFWNHVTLCQDGDDTTHTWIVKLHIAENHLGHILAKFYHLPLTL